MTEPSNEKTGSLKRAFEIDYTDQAATTQHYDTWASAYDADTSGHGYVGPAQAAEEFERHQPDRAARTLDVGCGTGLVGEALAALGYTAIEGTDISPQMLAVAEGKGVYDALFVGDIFAGYDVADDAYDGLISVGTFGPIGPAPLRECCRVVRAGGLLTIMVNTQFYADKAFARAFEDLNAAGLTETVAQATRAHLSGGEAIITTLRRL